MKYCENCGKELQEGATYCLNCGKKIEQTTPEVKQKKKGLPVWAIVLIVIFSVFIIFGIIGGVFVYSVADVVVNEIESTENDNKELSGTIGSTLKGKEFAITLIEAKTYTSIALNDYYTNTPEAGKIYMVYFLEVENISDEEEYFNTLNWNAYADGYSVSSTYLLGSVDGYESASGSLEPGMKLKGYVVYEVPEDCEEFQATYKENPYSSTSPAMTFKVKN